MSQEVETTGNKSLVARVADKFGIDAEKLLPALKQTAFKQSNGAQISNEQMMALMVVADQYGLNPFTKEIYAYPDKGGIVPVVGVDGWNRIINENPQMDGIEFEYSEETVTFKGKTCHVWIDCLIYRKDRRVPTKAREFFDEVKRDTNYHSPWDTHPNRMHRHKAEIQCARIAFGFAGIYDQDEAERILEATPQANNPDLPSFSPDQKNYFDQLIEQSDALNMELLKRSLSVGEFISLTHSFERGEKGKYGAIVKELLQDGFNQVVEIQEGLKVAFNADDETAVQEVIIDFDDKDLSIIIEGLDGAVIAYINNIKEGLTVQD